MDDVELCPPWWPRMIWWLIHHPHGPGDPPPIDRELFTQLDTHFAAVAITALAGRLSDKKIGEQVGNLAGKLRSSDPMPGLVAVGAGR